jgi:cyclopentanol dehydrogenase
MRLEGKVALISGGARGQGAVEAKLFAQEGAKVVIGDILDAEGQQVEAEINETGGECVYVHLDVTSEEDWGTAIGEAVSRFGKLDVLVNNAGIFPPASIEDTTEELWDQIMDINGKGVFLGTKLAIPEMRKAGGGSIINISSVAGLRASAGAAAYGASKGAVRLLTKSTAIQYAGDNIRANSVHPGVIETEMTLPNLLIDEDARRRSAERVPLGRIGQPEDVAWGVLFLASDESSFMTGSELVIDGGRTAR